MKKGALIFILFGLLGCGVKGKPQPPEEPPVLGRGEPNFFKATESIKINPSGPETNRVKPRKPIDDWDDEQ